MLFYGIVFDPKYKINDMADPDDGEDDAGNHHVRPHHHEKAKAHQQRYRDDDAHLSLHRHALFLHKKTPDVFCKA